MAEFLILASVAFAGYADAPGWVALLGAAALTIASWWSRLKVLRQQPGIPPSTKKTTYLVASIAINVVFAAVSYLAGRVLRWLLQG
jgi:hypothetical protein